MTREELRDEVAHTLIECRGDGCGSFEMADAVIRLVVEACCEDLTALAGPAEGGLGRLEEKARIGVLTAILRLRSTFLPPKDPSNG